MDPETLDEREQGEQWEADETVGRRRGRNCSNRLFRKATETTVQQQSEREEVTVDERNKLILPSTGSSPTKENDETFKGNAENESLSPSPYSPCSQLRRPPPHRHTER
jgi:hypothetical protein